VEAIHFLVTYRCTRSCPHCFVFGSPNGPGEMTTDQVHGYLRACAAMGIKKVFFEGGEPFLLYDRLPGWLEEASALGLRAGALSNGFWAGDEDRALRTLGRLKDSGLKSLMISTDDYHGGEEEARRAALAADASRALGLATTVAVTKIGGVMFRGRASSRLAGQVPQQKPDSLTKCPREKLDRPGRVHVDAFGHIHLCQGLSMGQAREGDDLRRIVEGYRPGEHPVVVPLLRGGPVELARTYGLALEDGYADACQLCYLSRKALRPRFPEYLAPDHLYGEGGPRER
jgi:hypothetical protein